MNILNYLRIKLSLLECDRKKNEQEIVLVQEAINEWVFIIEFNMMRSI
jgi:transposase-like protein